MGKTKYIEGIGIVQSGENEQYIEGVGAINKSTGQPTTEKKKPLQHEKSYTKML